MYRPTKHKSSECSNFSSSNPIFTLVCVCDFQLDLVIATEEGDISNYHANGEFDLIGLRAIRNVQIYSCCPEPYPDVTYTIVMKRRPMFYVFNLIIPCLLINGIGKFIYTLYNIMFPRISANVTRAFTLMYVNGLIVKDLSLKAFSYMYAIQSAELIGVLFRILTQIVLLGLSIIDIIILTKSTCHVCGNKFL